ncbi:MAG: hypothetical protein R3B48_09755 [Kofleriaceae bacterium]
MSGSGDPGASVPAAVGAPAASSVPIARLQALVLARAQTSARPLALGRLRAALQRFAGVDAAAAWADVVTAAIRALVVEGALDAAHRPRDPDEAQRRLGLAALPSWAQLTERVLPARALGLEDPRAAQRLRDRDAWAAAVAARALGLWTQGPPPSPAAFGDLLAWRRLELGGKAKRLPEEVRALFLQRELATRAAPAPRLLRLLAARELATPRTELRSLRDALVRRWLEAAPWPAVEAARAGQGAPSAPPPPSAVPAATPSPPSAAPAAAPSSLGVAPTAAPSSLGASPAAFPDEPTALPDEPTALPDELPDAVPAAFPDAVRAVVAAARLGTFGERKVFISAAWEDLRRAPAWRQLSLEAFKAELLAAHRAGQLALARADLVAAMDPSLVERSEIEASGATFHFIVREAP